MEAASASLRTPDRLWPLVLVSAAIHAVLVGVGALARPPPALDLDQKPIVAKLVRLGEKRPEQWLPRKDAAPPPAAAPASAVPVPAPTPAPTRPAAVPSPGAPPAPPRSPAAAAGKASDTLSRTLSRLGKEQAASRESWGDPSGSLEGDTSEASEGDRYLGLVTQALQSSYRLPATLSDQERLYLKATVILTIEPDGRISGFRFERRSGHEGFDQALERAVRQTRLPPPPAGLRQAYRTTGLGVNFRM